MPTLYGFYGYGLLSEIPLHGFPELPAGAQVDLVLERGDVPHTLGQAEWSSPFIEVLGGSVLLRFAAGRLRFLVEGGRRVRVDAPADIEPTEIETFLSAGVAGTVLHRRGGLPLHAACIAREGRAVALAGPSGRGKSTLAAALAGRGWTPVTDDVCRVDFRDDGAWAVPGPARFRLWPDAVLSLGGDPDGLASGRAHHPKRLLPVGDAAKGPVRLAAIVRLSLDTRLDRPRLEPLAGPSAVMPMGDLVYRCLLGRRLGNREGLFRGLMRLAGDAAIWRLTRGEGGSAPDDLVPLVEGILERGG